MTQTPPSYDVTSIRLHWFTAALVVILWCLGQTIDWFPSGAFRVAARSTHISVGATLALALCYRLWWRATAGRTLPPAGSGAAQWLAKSLHVVLYLMLAGTVVLGLANAWVRGDNIFGVFSIPAFDPGNKPLRHQVGDLHALFANILLGLATVHAAAGLIHHFIWKDDVLRRMLPTRR